MKVVVKGATYYVRFQHKTEVNSKKERKGTLCTIANEEGVIVSDGTTLVHPVDNGKAFNKEKGRKIALTGALADWEKEHRTTIWSEYSHWGKDRF